MDYIFFVDEWRKLIPWYVKIESINDIEDTIDKYGFPFLLKPVSFASGKGIVKVNNRKQAFKAYEFSKKGKVLKSTYQKFKDFFRIGLPNIWHGINKKDSFRFIASGIVDTYSEEYKCYINATVCMYMGKIHNVDVRINYDSFNIHAHEGVEDLKKIANDKYKKICNQTLYLIRNEKKYLETIGKDIGYLTFRVDLLIDLDKEQIKIAEFALKGGFGERIKNGGIFDKMKEVGWSQERITEYFDRELVDPVRFKALAKELNS